MSENIPRLVRDIRTGDLFHDSLSSISDITYMLLVIEHIDSHYFKCIIKLSDENFNRIIKWGFSASQSNYIRSDTTCIGRADEE